MRCTRSIFALIAAAIAGLTAGKAFAAEELVITAGPANRAIPIEDLAVYAETGETSRQLEVYFDDYVGEEGAKGIRKALNLQVVVDFVPFTQYLRSEGGSCFLGQIGRIVRPASSNVNSTQALRAGLINAAAPDGTMTLLEFFQKYPNRQIYVDQAQLSGKGEEADAFRTLLRDVLVASGLPIENTDVIEASASETTDDGSSKLVVPLMGVDYKLLDKNSFEMICGAASQES